MLDGQPVVGNCSCRCRWSPGNVRRSPLAVPSTWPRRSKDRSLPFSSHGWSWVLYCCTVPHRGANASLGHRLTEEPAPCASRPPNARKPLRRPTSGSIYSTACYGAFHWENPAKTSLGTGQRCVELGASCLRIDKGVSIWGVFPMADRQRCVQLGANPQKSHEVPQSDAP